MFVGFVGVENFQPLQWVQKVRSILHLLATLFHKKLRVFATLCLSVSTPLNFPGKDWIVGFRVKKHLTKFI